MKLFTFGAAALVVILLLATHRAQAAVTTNGDLQVQDSGAPGPATPPPAVNIKRISGTEGIVFTNTVGTFVYSVAIDAISSATNGSTNPLLLPNDTGLLAVTALSGRIVGVNAGGPVIQWDDGRLFLLSDSDGASFSAVRDPSSLFFDDRFAEFALGGQEAIVSGAPFGSNQNLAASLVNTSTSASPLEATARLLFWEDSSAAQTAGATPGLGPGTGGDNFLFNVDGGQPQYSEGLYTLADQDILEDDFDGINAALAAASLTAFDGADFAMLNAIFAAAGLGTWASGFDGDGSDPSSWDPYAGGAFNGDFWAEFNSESHIVAAVPEPISMLTWAGLAGIGGILTLRNRRKLTASV